MLCHSLERTLYYGSVRLTITSLSSGLDSGNDLELSGNGGNLLGESPVQVKESVK